MYDSSSYSNTTSRLWYAKAEASKYISYTGNGRYCYVTGLEPGTVTIHCQIIYQIYHPGYYYLGTWMEGYYTPEVADRYWIIEVVKAPDPVKPSEPVKPADPGSGGENPGGSGTGTNPGGSSSVQHRVALTQMAAKYQPQPKQSPIITPSAHCQQQRVHIMSLTAGIPHRKEVQKSQHRPGVSQTQHITPIGGNFLFQALKSHSIRTQGIECHIQNKKSAFCRRLSGCLLFKTEYEKRENSKSKNKLGQRFCTYAYEDRENLLYKDACLQERSVLRKKGVWKMEQYKEEKKVSAV